MANSYDWSFRGPLDDEVKVNYKLEQIIQLFQEVTNGLYSFAQCAVDDLACLRSKSTDEIAGFVNQARVNTRTVVSIRNN